MHIRVRIEINADISCIRTKRFFIFNEILNNLVYVVVYFFVFFSFLFLLK